MAEVAQLVAGKNDAELADDLRRDLREALEPVCKIMNRARAEGLVVNFNISPDGYGKNVIKEIMVVRPL